jgi:drug/metabolite transporter (DMT)-like permease
MSSQATGLLIGGLLPALLYSLGNICLKAANDSGIDIGPYLAVIGGSVLLVSLLFFLLSPGGEISLRSGLYTLGMGASWAIGTGLVAIAIARYGIPLGKVVPLFNMNTLLSVLLALWIFAEWKSVHVPRLLLGSALIVLGGVLVTRS